MAKRKPLSGDNIQNLEHQAFKIDDTTKEVWKNVTDDTTHDKLDTIAGALGVGVNTIPTIFNVNIINSNTEVSQVLPANTKSFLIKSRNKGSLRLAYVSGGTNTDYITIPMGTSYADVQFYTGQTVYFQSSKAGDIIEIIAHS